MNGYDMKSNGTMNVIHVDADKLAKPRFWASFLIDARGGVVRSTRHQGLQIVIPPGKVCQPTRITCKLIKVDKLPSRPVLKEGEAIVSRFVELGPAGLNFNGPILIELPHVASLHHDEREVIALRSNDGQTWQEQPTTSEEIVNSLIQSVSLPENRIYLSPNSASIKIFSSDFPRYFVAISRVRQTSQVINSDGAALTASIDSGISATFPRGSVTKETKVSLQVLPVPTTSIQLVLGSQEEDNISAGAVVTIEPRRRRFHTPISLSLPLPPTIVKGKGKAKQQTENLRLLYSITGGSNATQWEDITGSAAVNIDNSYMLFSSTVSARYWLVDCGTKVNASADSEEIVALATKVYQEVVAVPIMARFVVYAKRHSENEAQLRVLCLTVALETSNTLESQQNFDIVGTSDYIELTDGKPYCLEVSGNLVPAAASSSQLAVEIHPFCVNRLAFVVRVGDPLKRASCQLSVIPAVKRMYEFEVQNGPSVCNISVSLDQTEPGDTALEGQPPEQVEKNIEAAKLQAAQSRESLASLHETAADLPVGIKLADIAAALRGDWVTLASELAISDLEVIRIQTDFGNTTEQAMIMLHLWVSKANGRVQTLELERALKSVGRSDIVDRYIYGIGIDAANVQLANGSHHDDVLEPIDSHVDENLAHDAFADDSSIPACSDVVEPSSVYQIEEVWDGTKWSKKLVPKSSAQSDGDALMEEDVKVSILQPNDDGANLENSPLGNEQPIQPETLVSETATDVQATSDVLLSNPPPVDVIVDEPAADVNHVETPLGETRADENVAQADGQVEIAVADVHQEPMTTTPTVVVTQEEEVEVQPTATPAVVLTQDEGEVPQTDAPTVVVTQEQEVEVQPTATPAAVLTQDEGEVPQTDAPTVVVTQDQEEGEVPTAAAVAQSESPEAAVTNVAQLDQPAVDDKNSEPSANSDVAQEAEGDKQSAVQLSATDSSEPSSNAVVASNELDETLVADVIRRNETSTANVTE